MPFREKFYSGGRFLARALFTVGKFDGAPSLRHEKTDCAARQICLPQANADAFSDRHECGAEFIRDAYAANERRLDGTSAVLRRRLHDLPTAVPRFR